MALFDAVTKATGRSYCVDSSKSPFRFRDIYRVDPERTKAIVLARDYRAVVHSKMKRGQSLQSAATGWRQKMQAIDALTRDLPVDRVFRLKYESLCENPQHELRSMCSFLRINFSDEMLERKSESLHHIGGSPSKFDHGRRKISLDRSYLNQFTPDAHRRMRELVGKVAEQWGY